MRTVPRPSVLCAGTRVVCFFVACAICALDCGEGRAQNLKPGILWNVDNGQWSADASWDVGAPGEGDVASVRNGGTATVGQAVDKVDALSIRDGVVDIAAGGALEVAGETVTGGGGTLSVGGNGSLTTEVLANVGTLSVSGKDAQISVGGDFANLGTLSLSTSGADPYSIINVGGRASLGGGTIDLASTPDGASFDFGNSWPFMKAGSVSGQPSEILVGGVAPSLSRGLSLQVATGEDGTAAVTVGNVPIATVNRTDGNVTVSNVAGGPMAVKGYMLTSPSGLLSVDSWNSKTDQGLAGWVEANPLPTQLNETNLSGATTLAVGESVSLGAAYAGGAVAPRDEDVALSVLLEDGRVIDGAVEYAGPANDLVLSINSETGAATLQNLSALAGDFDVTGYTIKSPSGSLNAAGFTGIGDADWVLANPKNTALAELSLTANKVFSNGTVVNLGNIFTPGGTPDLTLEYGTKTFGLAVGTVEYGGGGGNPLDCNGDGVVNIDDTLCANAGNINDTVAAAGLLLGDLDGDGSVAFPDFLSMSANFGGPGNYQQGNVDLSEDGVAFADFLTLSANFGQSSNAAAVPEPTGALLGFLGLLGLLKFRRRAPQVLAVLLAVVVLSSTQQVQAQTEFDTRFIRIHPEGPNNQINNVVEARGILNGAIIDVIKNEDLTGKLDIIDLAGGGGSFNFVNNPYLNGVEDDTMIDFLQYVSGTLTIPAGEWTIAFGSDDGGFLNMPNISFLETFNENGLGRVDGDGEILFNSGRGHGWTGATFTVPSGGVTTPFEAMFHERGGGDSFEVAVADLHYDPSIEGLAEFITALGFELEDAAFDIEVTGDPFGSATPGDFNGDGNVDTADYQILTSNLGTGSALTQGDISGDGLVDLQDVGEFAAIFPAPAGAAAVPEPASLSLILMAAALLLGAGRRRNRG